MSRGRFKELYAPRLKFEMRLKYSWLHLKLYSMFQDLSRRSLKPVFGGFKTQFKFIKFRLCNPEYMFLSTALTCNEKN